MLNHFRGRPNTLADRRGEVLIAWPVTIAASLNRILPSGYFARPGVPAGGRPRQNGEHTVVVYGPQFDIVARIRIWTDGPRFVLDVSGRMAAVHPGEVPPVLSVAISEAGSVDHGFAESYAEVCRDLKLPC